MAEHILLGLASIIVLGIGAEWLAWRLRLPSILVLLIFGIVAGPVIGFLNPDALLGDLLLPIVSLAVAIILFEGGLNLRVSELRQVGGVVRKLITVGALVTWLIGAGAAYFLLNLDFAMALLLGAILVVSGPTVIMPLLRHLRPSGQLGSVLKWEGVVIDPIGAILAVLVFEAILAGGFREAAAVTAIGLLKTIVIGGGIGVLGAMLMVLLLRRFWIPDFLHGAISLTLVIGVFAVSNLLQTDSGLLAATVMGIYLANQKTVSVRHIVQFKENLRVLLISGLFILLSARLQVSYLGYISIGSLAFLGVLMLIARPASVALSTLGSGLSWRERSFLSWMAPRGIVAAAVSSVFTLRLVEAGYPQSELLLPITFMVIIFTVTIYGLTASPVARWLQVAEPNPQGVLIVGAHSWAQAIAGALQAEGYRVLVVDDNWANVSAARMAGLPTFYASILSQYALDEIELGGIGRMLALTSDNEFNSLAALQFIDAFGRSEVYQLPPKSEEKSPREMLSQHLQGRLLFGVGITYAYLSRRFAEGAVIRTTKLTQEFDYAAFRALYGEEGIPLFLIGQSGNLMVFTRDNPPNPRPSQTLISLVNPANDAPAKPGQRPEPGEKSK
jgi:NhaP-type Na+/H+ or K+/H+ antiporter